MENELQANEESLRNRDEVFSDSFRAGNRTYFLDVKANKFSELYITITESKRRLQQNGKYNYEKHHIYLFQEDFEKFVNSLNNVVDYVKQNRGSITATLPEHINENINDLLVPVLDFEDLDK